MMKNIAVLVSGGGTNLQALIDAQNRGEIIGGKITLVVSSNPDAYALKRAENNNIATKICEKKNYKDRAEYTAAIRDILLEAKADLVVYAGFMTILDEQIVKAFPNKMMNVHPALIPSFCGEGYWGLHVHEKVIESGVKLTGATVHFVTEECDGGPIICKRQARSNLMILLRFCKNELWRNVSGKFFPVPFLFFAKIRLKFTATEQK